MRLLTKDDLLKYIDFEEIYNDTKEGFIKFSNNQTITPPFTVFEIPENGGSIHFKYGYVIGSESFSFKYSGAFYANESKGLSNFLGLFIVFNSNTGEVELIIDDKGFLTDYRTGIAGSIATKTLARENSKTVAVIGTGVQARMQINALMNVMSSIETLRVYGRNSERAFEYAEEMQIKYPNLNVLVFDNPKDAVKDADIIYTVTYSNKPILMSDWIKKGTHITAVGACGPDMQELDENILAISNIVVVDSREACSTHGELHHAIDKNLFSKDSAIELGTFIANNLKRNETDITVCDLVGIGFQDAVIGNCIYRKVLKKGEK
jgi:ornithine cyclodeaminase